MARTGCGAVSRKPGAAGIVTALIGSIVHLDVQAFAALSVAMTAKKRLQVTRALDGTRLAYRQLKVACSLT